MVVVWNLAIHYLREDTGDTHVIAEQADGDSLADAVEAAVEAAREWVRRTGNELEPDDPCTLWINGLQGPVDVPGVDGSLPLEQIIAAVETGMAAWEARQQAADAETTHDQDPPRRELRRTDDADLEATWRELADTGILGDARTLGASTAEIDQAAAVIGTLTAELRTLFAIQAGGPEIVPHFRLLGLDEAVDTWQMWMKINDDLRAQWPTGGTMEEDAFHGVDAGSATEIYLAELIPFADGDGSSLCVDTRPGDLHGCISEYSAYATAQPPRWISLGGMVRDVLDCVRDGALLDEEWRQSGTTALAWKRAD